MEPGEIDLIIAVSCTGYLVPSLDVQLAAEIGLWPDVIRLPLTELGSAIRLGPPVAWGLAVLRRGGSSSSSSSTTQGLLLGVAGGLPAAFAELFEQLLVEEEEAAAVSVAGAALTRRLLTNGRKGWRPTGTAIWSH